MTEPQTEAGKALMRFMGWGPAWAKKIRRIELEAAAGLLDQNDRLRSALQQIIEPSLHSFEMDIIAAHREIARSVLRGSGAEEAARNE